MLFYSLGYDDVMLSKDGKMSSISTEGPNPVIHYSELEASFSDGETTLQITHMHAHHVASICIHIDHLAILSEISGRTIRKVVPPPPFLSFKHASIGMHSRSPAATQHIAIGNMLSHPAKWLQM